MRRLRAALLAAAAFFAVGSSTAAQPNPEWIRVAVVKSDPQVALQINGRFNIRSLAGGDVLQAGQRLPSTSVQPVSQGLSFGGSVIPARGVRITPEREAAISLNGRRLRGALDIVKQKNRLMVINHVSLEDYLQGVLSKEAPDYWPQEALKAIAIAARTYAIYQRYTKEAGDYDVTGDVLSQDYGGHSGEKAATTRAVKATAGVILSWRGKLFPPFYHSTCGGMTEHAAVMGDFDLEPLRGGIACKFCSASPFYRWQRRLSQADIGWALKKSSRGSIGTVRGLRVLSRTRSGRVKELEISGSKQTIRMTAFEFRSILGFDRIRSPYFSITSAGNSCIIEGRGWGHGVGMCQWGAAELARRGFTAAEILAYYYPGIQLGKVRELTARPVEVITGGLP